MTLDRDKARARWKRNKQADRKRKSVFPREISPGFVARVLCERDRRIAETPYLGQQWRQGFHYAAGTWEKALRFAADVWAADLILEFVWGPKGAKPSRVASWLESHADDHGYTVGSLPKMIYKARRRIETLETPVPWNRDQAIWPPFSPSSDELCEPASIGYTLVLAACEPSNARSELLRFDGVAAVQNSGREKLLRVRKRGTVATHAEASGRGWLDK